VTLKGNVVALDEARAAPNEEGRQSARILTHGTLEVRFYKPRGEDPQTPHTRDEIYVVASGRGAVVVGGERRPFVTGDLVFVPAGTEHRFCEFTDDFGVWVMFYGPEGGEAPSTGAVPRN
jgi:mannose-6-phosphate isomerase-like protein (cupin superfamily)